MDGTMLKAARLEKNWTQEEAALALEVTQAYLSMLERGHRPVSERFVRKALKVFSLPAIALPLRSEEVAMPASSRSATSAPNWARSVIRDFPIGGLEGGGTLRKSCWRR